MTRLVIGPKEAQEVVLVNLSEAVNDEFRFREVPGPAGIGDCQTAHTGRMGGLDSGGSVLDDEAFVCFQSAQAAYLPAQYAQSCQVATGIWFSRVNLVGTDDHLEVSLQAAFVQDNFNFVLPCP